MPKGAGAATSGKTLPTLTITRASGDRHNWQRQKRDGQAGVAASWDDRKGAKKLRIPYPDGASAKRAGIAERDRLKRAPVTFNVKLALGRPDASPECRVTVTCLYEQIGGQNMDDQRSRARTNIS